MNIVIAGSRDFKNYIMLESEMNALLHGVNSVVIFSGGADGADYLGECYAYEYGYHIVKFLPDWEKHGKAAGPIRNREMAKHADAVVAFWDGKSKGTKNMIEETKKLGKHLTIFKY